MSKTKLRRLRRSELLQLLIEQKKENERLQGELDRVRRQLEERRISIEESGSLAEAAIKVNAVFEAAQAAAAQYLENVEMRYFEAKQQELSTDAHLYAQRDSECEENQERDTNSEDSE